MRNKRRALFLLAEVGCIAVYAVAICPAMYAARGYFAVGGEAMILLLPFLIWLIYACTRELVSETRQISSHVYLETMQKLQQLQQLNQPKENDEGKDQLRIKRKAKPVFTYRKKRSICGFEQHRRLPRG